MLTTQIELPMDKIADFCRRWKIAKHSYFRLRAAPRFSGPRATWIFVASYSPEVHWSLLDRVHMQHELEDMLGRSVDLLNRRALEHDRQNDRAAGILAQAQLLYAES